MSDPSRSSTSAHSAQTTHSAHSARSASLFISNLTWWTNEDDLRIAFGEMAGKVKNVHFIEHKVNGKSKGIAIVEFEDEAAASKAKEIADGKEIHGLACGVTYARSPPIKPHERGRKRKG